MIIKVQDDNLKDKYLVEAAFIRWAETNTVLETYVRVSETKNVHAGIEQTPSLRLKLHHGDRVFIMNNEGKTVDSKRIVLDADADAGLSPDKEEILKLIRTSWKRTPDENLLELLGSCFAAGDISGINDDELKKNLVVLTEL